MTRRCWVGAVGREAESDLVRGESHHWFAQAYFSLHMRQSCLSA